MTTKVVPNPKYPTCLKKTTATKTQQQMFNEAKNLIRLHNYLASENRIFTDSLTNNRKMAIRRKSTLNSNSEWQLFLIVCLVLIIPSLFGLAISDLMEQ